MINYLRRLFTKKRPYFTMTSAYSQHDCSYIGEPTMAERLWKKYGIERFEFADLGHKVCSIGFSPRDKKWYGWSHRAIFGFGIGHVVKAGDCAASSGWSEDYLKEHPQANKAVPVGFTVTTFDEAKRVAIAFAESVS